MNNVIRAGLYTQTAAYASARVNFCNVTLVVYADSVSRTNFNAVTVAEAGKGAESVTGEIHISRRTAGYTLVFVFLLLRRASSVAGNVCNLLHNLR